MKQVKNLLFIMLLVATVSVQAQVGIGTPTPDPSAQLDVSSTTKGFLPPRMTSAERYAISNPAEGLIIYCTDCDSSGQPQFYDGVKWRNMLGGIASGTFPGTVTIGTQIWMSKNLDVRTYRNGAAIPQVTDSAQWTNLTTGAWCWYNNDSATYAATYGRLYNWYAVADTRGLCPTGSHVPLNGEWNTLTNYLGDLSVAGGKMKDTGTIHWRTPNSGATNSSGFTGLPGGSRGSDGIFINVTNMGIWWSSSEFIPTSGPITNAWYRSVYYSNGNAAKDNIYKTHGFAVRCLRD